jgi:Spx/MgsR family transcriptional regulator
LRKGVQLEERDIFKQPLSEAEIRHLLQRVPLEALVSFKSPSYRALPSKLEGLKPEEVVRLLASEPRLLRRPIVEAGDRLIVGFEPKALEDLIAGLGQ